MNETAPPRRPPPPDADSRDARAIAVRVLGDVYRRSGFVAAALDEALRQSGSIDPRDRALATELSYGVVRTRPALEARLEALAPRGIAGGDLHVMLHLLVAAYQLLFLERVPAFAAVNEAVTAVTELRGKKVGGFVNAVLRKLSMQQLSLHDAIRQSVPDWLFAEISAAVGDRPAHGLFGLSGGSSNAALAAERPDTTPVCVRFRSGVVIPEWAKEGAPGLLVPALRRFTGRGDPRRHPEFSQGQFLVQEEGAVFAGLSLGVRPQDKVLDVCAGRGQKSTLLAQQLEAGDGQLWVSDLSAKKLKALQVEFLRLGLPKPNAIAHDWRAPSDDFPTDFDRVLVDAPCTGTGTLRRRPEIVSRLVPEDVERLAALSENILRTAATRLAPGGRLVFIVCSVLRRECETVVERVSDLLTLVEFDAPEVTEHFGQVSQLRLLPDQHRTDGFFVASLQLKG